MYFLCNEKFKSKVIDQLGIETIFQKKIVINGYQSNNTPNGQYYITDSEPDNIIELLALQISDEDIWNLDKFQSPIAFEKVYLNIQSQKFEKNVRSDYYSYMLRPFSDPNHIDLETIRNNITNNFQLNKSDIYLLIPGKISKSQTGTYNAKHCDNILFSLFKEQINSCIETEYRSNFFSNMKRECLGEIDLNFKDFTDGLQYHQKALIYIVIHHTGFCILEIVVPCCYIGGNKLLNYYCANQLKYSYCGNDYDLDTLLLFLNIRKFGKQRSLVFSYGKITDEELINALANEEFPMGKIGGDFQRIIKRNIAQYDTADVYVSQETIVEKTQNIIIDYEARISYQVIELFFVEMILFQDASIDKIHIDLLGECEKLKKGLNYGDSINKLDQISFDMVQALKFGDYDQFRFPTVRESSKKIAKSFGTDYMFEKYEASKSLLSSVIAATKRIREEKNNLVKTRFLFFLTALTSIETLGEIISKFYEEKIEILSCYLIATAILSVFFLIYKLILFFIKKRRKNDFN